MIFVKNGMIIMFILQFILNVLALNNPDDQWAASLFLLWSTILLIFQSKYFRVWVSVRYLIQILNSIRKAHLHLILIITILGK